jgi:hypothetical protein
MGSRSLAVISVPNIAIISIFPISSSIPLRHMLLFRPGYLPRFLPPLAFSQFHSFLTRAFSSFFTFSSFRVSPPIALIPLLIPSSRRYGIFASTSVTIPLLTIPLFSRTNHFLVFIFPNPQCLPRLWSGRIHISMNDHQIARTVHRRTHGPQIARQTQSTKLSTSIHS